MEQAINLDFVFLRRNGQTKRAVEEALDLCSNAGIRFLDYLPDIRVPDSLPLAKRQREELEKRNMRVIQSHFPFFRYDGPGIREKIIAAAQPAAAAAAALGSKYMVLHGNEYAFESFDPETCITRTKELLFPAVEACIQHGILPVMENVGEAVDAPCRMHFGSSAEEILALIDAFSGAVAGCCWDSGHHNVAYKDRAQFLSALDLPAPSIVCTHIHDNSLDLDLHKPAFSGTIPWEQVMPILKKHNYGGDLSWEFVYERIPDELYGDFLTFVHRSGEYLTDIFNRS